MTTESIDQLNHENFAMPIADFARDLVRQAALGGELIEPVLDIVSDAYITFFLDKGWTISEIEPALAELVSQLVREYETVSLEV